MIVCIKDSGGFTRFHVNGNYLLRKVTGIIPTLCFLLGAQGVLILFRTGNFKLPRQILSGAGHRRVAVGIEQSNHQAVLEFSSTQSEP